MVESKIMIHLYANECQERQENMPIIMHVYKHIHALNLNKIYFRFKECNPYPKQDDIKRYII